LDEEGGLIDEAFVDSGTVPPGIVAALSGDVALPTSPVAPCVLTLIDRFRVDVVTFADVCGSGGVLAQINVGTAASSTNPHDVLGLDGTRALVSRHRPQYGEHSDSGAGNDLVVVDWSRRRSTSQIDLSSLDTEVAIEVVNGDGETVTMVVHVYARPSHMVKLKSDSTERVVVGLARLDRTFMTAGPGAVALVDLATGQVLPLELPRLAGCGEVDPVPGRTDLAVVTCGGMAFVDEDSRRAQAGLVVLKLAVDGSVTVQSSWRAADHPWEPVYNTSTVPIDSNQVVVTAMGSNSGTVDRVGIISTEGDETIRLLDAEDAFVIGEGYYDPSRRMLLLPDASGGVVRRFRRDSLGFHEIEPVDTAGCRGLPPRQIRPLVNSHD
jgi:hypothetical protein